MKVLIVDVGLGNIQSVKNILLKIGGDAEVVTRPNQLVGADKIILPGVGKFDYAMQTLRKGDWIEPLEKAVLQQKVPVLGICLGMQLMCRESEEGELPGLGWIDAKVERIDPGPSSYKIPHMGWNTVHLEKETPLLLESECPARYYFVHSYHVRCADEEDIMLSTTYSEKMTVGFQRDHIYGVQFHPEKSHRFGMQMMKHFWEL